MIRFEIEDLDHDYIIDVIMSAIADTFVIAGTLDFDLPISIPEGETPEYDFRIENFFVKNKNLYLLGIPEHKLSESILISLQTAGTVNIGANAHVSSPLLTTEDSNGLPWISDNLNISLNSRSVMTFTLYVGRFERYSIPEIHMVKELNAEFTSERVTIKPLDTEDNEEESDGNTD